MVEWRERFRGIARQALSKKATYGPDIDLNEYDWGDSSSISDKPISLPRQVVERAEALGVDVTGKSGSGVYLQLDRSFLYSYIAKTLEKYGIEILSIEDALEEYEWLRDYYWRAVPVDQDKYTAMTELQGRHGYFIYVPPEVRVKEPIHACLFIHRESIAQAVHNIVVVDKDAELNLVTACSALPAKALHIGVSEFYVKKGAKLSFTMVHFWGPTVHVRSRTGVIVEDSGVFTNYYVHMAPVKSLQAYPSVVLQGDDSSAYLVSILMAAEESLLDVGGRIIFKGRNTRGEVISRSIVKGRATTIMRGELIAQSNARGHIDCKSLLLSPKASSEAVPVIRSLTDSAELTHEAAIGKISQEELEYLMTKGFSEDEATSLIVRGFLEAGIEKLPQKLQSYMNKVLDIVAKHAKG